MERKKQTGLHEARSVRHNAFGWRSAARKACHRTFKAFYGQNGVYSVLMLQERLSPTLPRQQAPASSTKTAGVHTGSATEVRSTATIRIREPIRKNSPLPAQVSTA